MFGKYVDFTGRARRAEYWWFGLFLLIVGVGLSVIEAVLFGRAMGHYGFLSGIFNLAAFLPSLGVSIRRLHDVDRSGWWLLILLIPLVGTLLVLYWFVQRGTVGPNRYGPDPVT